MHAQQFGGRPERAVGRRLRSGGGPVEIGFVGALFVGIDVVLQGIDADGGVEIAAEHHEVEENFAGIPGGPVRGGQVVPVDEAAGVFDDGPGGNAVGAVGFAGPGPVFAEVVDGEIFVRGQDPQGFARGFGGGDPQPFAQQFGPFRPGQGSGPRLQVEGESAAERDRREREDQRHARPGRGAPGHQPTFAGGGPEEPVAAAAAAARRAWIFARSRRSSSSRSRYFRSRLRAETSRRRCFSARAQA